MNKIRQMLIKCWLIFILFCACKVLLDIISIDSIPHLEMKRFADTNSFDVLDPESQFFGLIYRDTYGKPTLLETNREAFYENYTKSLPKWEQYYPRLMRSLQIYTKQNPAKNTSKFTSPHHSYVRLNKIKKEYKVGEMFEVDVQTKDFTGKAKRFGGDYFRARLVEVSTANDSLPDGIPCVVEDHMSGTYTVRAPLPVPGNFKLEVVLSASLEAVAASIDWSADRVHQGFIFQGTLDTEEKVECNVDLILYDKYKDKKICNYSNPRNGEAYFCGKPASGKCSSIRFLKVNDSCNNDPFDLNHQLLHRFQANQPIKELPHLVKVTSLKSETKQDILARIRQNVANANNIGSQILSHTTGMVYSRQWVSFVRNYERPQAEDFAKCFSNKLVFMIGDSTMRQFFLFAAKEFKLQIRQKNETKFYHVPRLGISKKQNITIYYRAHGIPMRLSGPPNLCTYMTDIINEITGGKNVIIIITIGLHYIEFDPAFYIHRLIGIRKALEHHLNKYPETKIIVKGLNKSQLEKLGMPYEWLVIRYDKILREMFKDLKNSIYIDLLDMTTLWFLTKSYHPEEPVIREQAYLMFSYICDI